MPILHTFDYARPKNLDEALKLLSNGKKAVLLAGGTDLIDMLKDGVLQPDLVVDLKGLSALNTISFENNTLSIGAGATFSDLIESKIIGEKFPVIADCAKTVASVGIRNRATVVGNICSAVPCMDSGPMLLAYGAQVVVKGAGGTRKIPVEQFFVSNRKTTLGKGEIVTSVALPLPTVKHAGCWVKLGRYNGEDLAQVNLMILALADGTFRIAFGAVAATPVRAKEVEKLLNGQNISPALIEKALKLIEEEIHPITDVRASKEYRMHMAKVMLERGLRAAISRLSGGGPEYGTSVI